MFAARGFRFGPGLLVAAAFIGPGTVVTASRAGAETGCGLLWAIALATLAAILLQLLAARIGILEQTGLGERLRKSLADRYWFYPVAGLILCALGIGNAAYQTGNLTGAAAGLVSVAGGNGSGWVLGLAALNLLILSIGSYRIVQRILIALVMLLSGCFLLTAFLAWPSTSDLIDGLRPSLDRQTATLTLAVIGTTVVPYNLFLHASSAAENWKGVDREKALRQSASDSILSIGLGGFVTAAIVVTAHQAFFLQDRRPGGLADMAEQLSPVLGSLSSVGFAVGVFSAGLTSSLTAPLATAYALCGILGWPADAKHWRFRCIAYSIVLCGTFLAVTLQASPAEIIVLAQVANGLLLPIIATLILGFVSGDKRRRPNVALLCAGWLVVVAVTLLASWRLWQAIVA